MAARGNGVDEIFIIVLTRDKPSGIFFFNENEWKQIDYYLKSSRMKKWDWKPVIFIKTLIDLLGTFQVTCDDLNQSGLFCFVIFNKTCWC